MKEYKTPEMEVVEFWAEDILNSSLGCDNEIPAWTCENELPTVPDFE